MADSYNIGQFRRTDLNADAYITTIKTLDKVTDTTETTDSIITFDDACINDISLTPSNSYYFRFAVKRLPSATQEFTIILRHDDNSISNDEEQTIRSFTVPSGPSGAVAYELIFTPNDVYSKIVFKLKRIKSDYASSRVMIITDVSISSIYNVVEKIGKKLKQIGIQGPPGLLFVLNGEEMRIGRRGIYELCYDNISVSYIGFVLKESIFTQATGDSAAVDYFIMDYKY